jgi:hypothetical protein
VPEIKRVMYSTEHPLGPSVGEDVRCCKWAINRYEAGLIPGPPYDKSFGKLMDEAVLVIRQREGLRARHRIDQELFDILWRYMDAYRRLKYRRFEVPTPPPPPTPSLVSPLPKGSSGATCQRLHWTAGLNGNAAFDFCAPPGTPILAVCDARVMYVSGHDPNEDTWDSQGVFGWSVHYMSLDSYWHYLTHLGGQRPNFVPGERLRVGQVLGRVGDQDFRPDHLHLGITSPRGTADAARRIAATAAAPRIAPVL